MEGKYLKIIERLKELSRKGLSSEIHREIKNLVGFKLPRSHRWRLAYLARSNNLPLLAIQLLHPIVRPEKPLEPPASNQELAEYASSLFSIGAGKEANKILSELDPSQIPQALLYRALACFNLWEYQETIPLLNEYIEREPDPYLNTVGKTKLAAAMIFLGFSEASQLLAELRSKTKEKDYWLLYGSSLELSAQISLSSKKFQESKRLLNEAANVLQKSKNFNDFFVRKWQAIVDLYQSPESPQALYNLEKIKKEGAKYQSWETVRTCDLHIATATKNPALFAKVYFGTPSPAYRQAIKKKIPQKWSLPQKYLLTSPHLTTPLWMLDLKLGTEQSGKCQLKPGRLLHQALVLLIKDFYHPQQIGALHSELFPHSYFNPISSPNRVYQVISRLRNWINNSGLPMHIQENHSHYWAQVRSGLSVLIREEDSNTLTPNQTLFDRLQKIGFEEFSAKQVCHQLGLSRSAFNRFSKWAIEEGLLEKRGQSSSTCYRLISLAA